MRNHQAVPFSAVHEGSVLPLTIVEILERSEQGVTRPFLCRCDDDRLYYVKGHAAGTRSLLCEWLAGHLARALGLPVPEFAVVEAPQALIEIAVEGRDLGAGPAFASLQATSPQWLSVAHRQDVPTSLQQDVVMFDWWVRNQDRTLTEMGGNPNLLWQPGSKKLVVIDHNSAFDPAFDERLFLGTHVFAAMLSEVFDDLVARMEYARRFRQALVGWKQACENAPDAWWFVDEERTVSTDFDINAALITLDRFNHEDFWKLVP